MNLMRLALLLSFCSISISSAWSVDSFQRIVELTIEGKRFISPRYTSPSIATTKAV